MDRNKILIAMALFLVMGVVLGATVCVLQTRLVTTSEPLTAQITDDLYIDYPGESDDVTLTIVNDATVGYGLIITPQVTGDATISEGTPDGNCIVGIEGNYNINADCSGTITYTVTADPDANPGEIQVSFTVQREGQF